MMQSKVALSSAPFTALPTATQRPSRRDGRQIAKVYASDRSESTGLVGGLNQL